MSVQFDSSRNRWVVRWSEAGRQRTRRFVHEGVAREFDAERREAKTAARDRGEMRVQTIEDQLLTDGQATGVYSYATKAGVRWRIAVKRADGTVTTRRGYHTHEAGDSSTRPAHAHAGISRRRVVRMLLATVAGREAALSDCRLPRGPGDARPQAPSPPPRPRTRRRDQRATHPGLDGSDDRRATVARGPGRRTRRSCEVPFELERRGSGVMRFGTHSRVCGRSRSPGSRVISRSSAIRPSSRSERSADAEIRPGAEREMVGDLRAMQVELGRRVVVRLVEIRRRGHPVQPRARGNRDVAELTFPSGSSDSSRGWDPGSAASPRSRRGSARGRRRPAPSGRGPRAGGTRPGRS